jgi:hypothetical protein
LAAKPPNPPLILPNPPVDEVAAWPNAPATGLEDCPKADPPNAAGATGFELCPKPVPPKAGADVDAVPAVLAADAEDANVEPPALPNVAGLDGECWPKPVNADEEPPNAVAGLMNDAEVLLACCGSG